MRREYRRQTFEKLYQAIAQKLLALEPPIRILNNKGRQDTGQLGVNWDGPEKSSDQANAAAAIHKALAQQGLFEESEHLNFGKLLYTKRNELERDPNRQTVVIQGRLYNEGLLRYLGYASLPAFEAAHDIAVEKPPVMDHSQRATTEPAVSPEAPYTYYMGAYYSFRSYRVNKFILAIQYTDQPTGPMNCWQWGFHGNERLHAPDHLPDKISSVRFSGKAEVRGRHLYINLEAPASENIPAMEMHLVGICDQLGGVGIQQQEAIPCALQTVSLDHYTVSVETYLLRCSEDDAKLLLENPAAYYDPRLSADVLLKNPAREKSLQLYLMLQRRNFRVKFKPNASDLDNLEYRGNLVSKYTERLSGEYRIWNFGLRRGIVIQSKLVISTEVPYRTLFYPFLKEEIRRSNPGLEEQLAVLVISNEVRHDQLCFSTFIKRGLTLVNYAIFDIRNLTDNNWVEGMFLTTGYDELGIIGGYAVMCKVKPGQTCEPMSLAREAAQQYASELGLNDMYNGLRSLWKRKLWKQKSNTIFGCYAIVTRAEKGILMVRRTVGPYKDLFDLPGGELLHGETPAGGLRRSVYEDTGIPIEQEGELWRNESATLPWNRPDRIEENLHHIGALYRVNGDSLSIPHLNSLASWVLPGQYQKNAFSPFALKAIETWEF